MEHPDLIIRNGTIIDGTGGEPYVADLAILRGVIASVGKIQSTGVEEIDASGLLVTPGWVDIHTHYDGQVTWDPLVRPSSQLGTTTAVMGNCGVGFAPVRPEGRESLIRLMEGVEDIPGTALHAGLKWGWESFPQYLDVLDRTPRDIDIAAQVPHSALRVFVMGERGARREPAHPQDIAQMGALVREAIDAGALGFSTSRVIFHRSIDGDLAPSVGAAHLELLGIADAMREAGAGVIQLASDFYDHANGEYDLILALARRSGRPLSFSFVETNDRADFWEHAETLLAEADIAGLSIMAQVQGRAVGLLLSLRGSVHPYVTRPSYQAISKQPIAERLAIMRTPEFRSRLICEKPDEGHPFVNELARSWERLFELGDPPEYAPSPEQSIAAQAVATGRDPEDLIFEILTAGDGSGYLYFPMANFRNGNYDSLARLLNHPGTMAGLSDGGAHVGVICDASVATYMLSYWCRDRDCGDKLHLPSVVARQTRIPAAAVGLLDRGVLARGYRADINIIDFNRLRLRAPKFVYDLPAGERRLLQEAEGYVATIVAGQAIYCNGTATGALPGKLVRGAQPAPIINHVENGDHFGSFEE